MGQCLLLMGLLPSLMALASDHVTEILVLLLLASSLDIWTSLDVTARQQQACNRADVTPYGSTGQPLMKL
jgi:hypothetical protein